MTLEKEIANFLTENSWFKSVDTVAFLAAGEYNENYKITSAGKNYVFRINHGSQLQLGNNQVAYEYSVLKRTTRSKITPIVFAYTINRQFHGHNVLLMSFIPGRSFSYQQDYLKAAKTFAKIHGLFGHTGFIELANDAPMQMIFQPRPVKAILQESRLMIERFIDHPLKQPYRLIKNYADEIEAKAESLDNIFQELPQVIVNTEVNSGNFIVNENIAYLVDWEKAVVSTELQDIGHFLVPTTTKWKTDFQFFRDTKVEFLKKYLAFRNRKIKVRDFLHLEEEMESVILLRALSWCYMAYYEYKTENKSLTDSVTLKKISAYLKDLEWLLK